MNHTNNALAPDQRSRVDFPIDFVRGSFPAIDHAAPFVFFDNGAGAQAPKIVLDSVARHLLEFNVARGGRYSKSREVDRIIVDARTSTAALLNATDPSEVAFGMNATSFIRLVSSAIGQTIRQPRNEIVLTDLDHDSNVATWMALARAGAKIVWWKLRDDRRLHLEDLLPLLSHRTRLVACTVGSHALGTLVDVAAVCGAAHSAGAEVFLDCVHYAPHALIDVQAWDCDYIVCSGYKMFSAHMGFLWGKRAKLDALPIFHEEFIPDTAPYKIEAGTFIYENVASMGAAVEYLAGLGVACSAGAGDSLRDKLVVAMSAIRRYEQDLSRHMLQVLAEAGATVYGISDIAHVGERVPTFCFNLRNIHSAAVTQHMATREIGIRDGHMYAPQLMARLGLSMDRGAVRASLVHYNCRDEIDRFGEALRELTGLKSHV